MNDAMHLVAKVWYRLYFGVMLACSLAIITAYLAGELTNIGIAETLGLRLVVVVIAGLHVLYSVSLYWIIEKFSQPLAMVISSMFFTLLLLSGLSGAEMASGSWAYVGMWFVGASFVGMYGLPFSLGTILFACTYVLLQSDFELARISAQSWALAGGSVLVTPLSYLFWKRHYINEQEARLSQLSGMLETNQEQSVILIQSIADGVIVTDTSGKINLMNRTSANMTGWTIDEGQGVDIKQVLKVAKEKGEPISDEEYPFTAVLAHKAFINQNLQLTSRNGKKMVVSLVISPVVTPKGEVFGAVAVLRDISEERAAEQQRGEFISTASHEMRTPVAAIEGYLALALNNKVSTIDNRAKGYLEKAHASTQHLGKLFQDLLTSAKAEDGRLSSHPVVVEMGSFLEQLVEDLRFAAQKKNLLAEFVIGDTSETIDATNDSKESPKVIKPLYYVHADPERLREVVTNLFDNAIKYTDQGKISLGLTGDSEVVQIYILDTGSGIPAEDIPHLFQKFYRVDNSATRVIGGTGLGLFICRKIIELYHGRIWVESELGKGSTFFINLPRINTQKAAELQASEANNQLAPLSSPNTSPGT